MKFAPEISFEIYWHFGRNADHLFQHFLGVSLLWNNMYYIWWCLSMMECYTLFYLSVELNYRKPTINHREVRVKNINPWWQMDVFASKAINKIDSLCSHYTKNVSRTPSSTLFTQPSVITYNLDQWFLRWWSCSVHIERWLKGVGKGVNLAYGFWVQLYKAILKSIGYEYTLWQRVNVTLKHWQDFSSQQATCGWKYFKPCCSSFPANRLDAKTSAGTTLYHIYPGPLLLTWFNFNPSMDK